MRVIKPFETFWKRIFDFIIDEELPPFDILHEVVIVPSVVTPSKALKKELGKFKKVFESDDPKLLAIGVVMATFDYYAGSRRLPKASYRVLELLYDAIMKDLRKSPIDTVSFEEIYKIGGMEDINDPYIRKLSIYFINCALKRNCRRENIEKLLQKLLEEEQQMTPKNSTTTATEGIFIASLLSGQEHATKPLEEIIKELGYSEKTMLDILRAEKKGDKIKLSAKLLPYLVAIVHKYINIQKIEQEYQNTIKNLRQQLENLHQAYRQELLFMLKEHETLIDEINKLRNEVRIVERPADVSKYEERIAELEAEIKRLQEQRDYYQELVETLKEQLSEAPTKEFKPLEKSVTIAYFGLPNPALEQFLANYNVELRLYSPLTKPQVVPTLPIVFNIDVASHIVWWELKDRKPLIVSGSNAERIGKRILEWLQYS